MIQKSQQLKLDVQAIISALQTARILKSQNPPRKDDALNVLLGIEVKIRIWAALSWFLQQQFLPNAILQKFHKSLGACHCSCSKFKVGLKHYEELRKLIRMSEASSETKKVDEAVVGLTMSDVYAQQGKIDF